MRDLHTVGGGLPTKATVTTAEGKKRSGNTGTLLTHRTYLADAAFTVALTTEPEHAASLTAWAQALRTPQWPLYLGRRSCPPKGPLLLGAAENALHHLIHLPLAAPTPYSGEHLARGITSLAQLRGLEGQRVKAHYRLLAKQYKIGRFRRAYDPASWDTQDPVNLALSSANTCLYGIVHAAILALGCSAALGYVHSGNQQSFVYDIADLYKAELTIPLAFSLHSSPNPEAEARRSFRDGLRLFALLPRIVTDIQTLLDPTTPHETPDPEEQLVDLWDPITGTLPGGTNHATHL
jgi:hypothetical protein